MEDEPRSNLLGLQSQGIRTISSEYTRLMTVLPAAVLTIHCLVVIPVVLFGRMERADERISFGLFALILTAFTILALCYAVKFKTVRLDKTHLYVAGFFKQTTIPLSQVEHVYAWPGGCPVIVRLKQPSVFGRSIWFMGKLIPFLFSTRHPIVLELRLLVEANRKEADRKC